MSSAHSLAKGGSANGYSFFEQSCATSVLEDLDWLDDACFSAHRHLCNDTIVKGLSNYLQLSKVRLQLSLAPCARH